MVQEYIEIPVLNRYLILDWCEAFDMFESMPYMYSTQAFPPDTRYIEENGQLYALAWAGSYAHVFAVPTPTFH